MAYQTEDNIREAFAGESAANRRYTLFAAKALNEGFPSVAKLFRAAAEAEMIHARNHLAAIDAIGSTKDNVLAASMGERSEFTYMYPAFIEKAQLERNDRAERTFDWANKVEKIHYSYFDKAYLEMKEGKVPVNNTYYVCQTCGNTVTGSPPEKCPICGSPGARFKEVE